MTDFLNFLKHTLIMAGLVSAITIGILLLLAAINGVIKLIMLCA